MDKRPQDVVLNSCTLVEAMGRWPSFHDARLRRASRVGADCRATVHVFEMTSEVDAAGYFILTKHHLVTLDMVAVVDCDLPDGFDGDILDSLAVGLCEGGVVVEFESVVDLDRSWRVVCQEVRVSEVTPCDAEGRPV